MAKIVTNGGRGGFASGSLPHTVSVVPGEYAPAYRFVHALTGQEVAMVRLDAVEA